jgi:hypothetical protein
MKLLIGLKNAGFLGWICVPLKEKLKKSKLQSKCHKIRTDWQCHGKHWILMPRCQTQSMSLWQNREKYRNFSLLKVYFNPRSVLKNESTWIVLKHMKRVIVL